MDLQILISDIDFQFNGTQRVSLTSEEWQTLKSAVLAQQTNNRPSTPCKHEQFHTYEVTECVECGFKLPTL